MRKFSLLRDILLAVGLVRADDVIAPEVAPWELLELAHSDDYLSKLRHGTLSRDEERRLGLPWSEALVRRSRLATSGGMGNSPDDVDRIMGSQPRRRIETLKPRTGETVRLLREPAFILSSAILWPSSACLIRRRRSETRCRRPR